VNAVPDAEETAAILAALSVLAGSDAEGDAMPVPSRWRAAGRVYETSPEMRRANRSVRRP